MSRYVFIRLGQMVIALLLFSVIIFGLVRIHGDPVVLFLSPNSTQEDYQRIRHNLGLDEPIYVQYGVFLANIVQGDFGRSTYTGKPVTDSIKETLPNTFYLVALSMTTALALGIPLGVTAATKRGTVLDGFARVIAGLGQAVPSFWLALLMIQLFAITLDVVPVLRTGGWMGWILPVAVLSFSAMPGPIRLVRSSMLEVLETEYIKLARVKGLSERLVIWKHALRNSLLPVLGFAAVQLALMITGAIVVEMVFAWPGIGGLAYRAIITKDFPLIQGITFVTAFIVLIANLVTDIVYVLVDPRIRLTT